MSEKRKTLDIPFKTLLLPLRFRRKAACSKFADVDHEVIEVSSFVL